MPAPKDPVKYEEWRERIALAHIGLIISKEVRERMGNSHRGKKHPYRSKEVREHYSEANKGKIPWNKGLKGVQVAWNKGITGWHRSKESVEKQRLSITGIPKRNNENYHKPKSESHKANISKTLRVVYPKGENHHCWKGGTSFIPYCFKFNERRKRAVRSFFGFRCLACGIHQDENLIAVKNGMKPVKLAVHHVDHDHDQGCNGKPFNLVPFCNSCHSKEGQHEEEYRQYVNQIIRDGFAWGIWSESEYMKKVMYDEEPTNVC